MSTQEQLDERLALPALEQIERALAEVRRMCQPGTRWHMTIPVDVEDSDVMISGALVAAKKELLARGVVPSAPSPSSAEFLTKYESIGHWCPEGDVVRPFSFSVCSMCMGKDAVQIVQPRGLSSAAAPPSLAQILLESNSWETGAKLNQKFTGREAEMLATWLTEHGVTVCTPLSIRRVDSGGVAPAGEDVL